jgi:hypothetical protein
MPTRKIIHSLNGRWSGEYLDQETADKIESLYEVYNQDKYYNDLKHSIRDCNTEQIAESVSNETDVFNPPEGTLSESQTITAAFGILSRRCVFGDSVGLGKSPEVSAVINNIERIDNTRHRVLVISEDITRAEPMRDKMIQFTGKYYGLSTGQKADVQSIIDSYQEFGVVNNLVATVSIIKQPLFQQFVEWYKSTVGTDPYDVVVVDESHTLSNKNLQYNSAITLFKDVKNKFCLNATEFDSSLMEFYNQIAFCDETLLPTRTAFQKDYCVLVPNRFGRGFTPSGKYKNAEDFKKKIGYRYWADTRIHRGGKVLGSTAKIFKVEDNSYQNQLQKSTSMSRLAINAPWAIDKLAAMTKEYCPKLGVLQSELEGIFTDNKQAVVLLYANYKEAQQGISHLLDNMKIDHDIVNGETDDADRAAIIRKAKLVKSPYVLITNVDRGLDFGFINHAVFYEFPTVSRAIQFEGRLTRSLHIVNKHISVLLAPYEYKKFIKEGHAKAEALSKFTNADNSLILELLTNNVDEVSHE